MLIVFRGLPGTGKSYLARMLLDARPGLAALSRDALRAAMFPRPSFSSEEKSLVDQVVLAAAEVLLAGGRDVVIDGMALSSASQVEGFARAAEQAGAAVRIIECTCSEQTALARIEADGSAHPAGDRSARLYHEVKARFQSLARPHLAVDTDRDARQNLRRIIDYMGTGD